ncbi:hypothetical protein BDZ89DRAFT_964064, partial [Hymenopellis radicata]
IRTKGVAGTGNVVEVVRHSLKMTAEIRQVSAMSEEKMYVFARDIRAPFHLVKETAHLKKLPVVNFAASGLATPADAAMMMQLGCDGVFVGSGIFKVSARPLPSFPFHSFPSGFCHPSLLRRRRMTAIVTGGLLPTTMIPRH